MLSLLLSVCVAVCTHAETKDVVTELLALPPVPHVEVTDPVKAHEPLPPDADASLGILVRYWSDPARENPPDAIRERLVEAIEQYPQSVPALVGHMPWREDLCPRLKPFAADSKVDAWMLTRCPSERERLVEAAARARDGEDLVTMGGELSMLARIDDEAAKPVLRKLGESAHPRTRALALSLLYRSDPSEELRAMLRTIAEDRLAPGYSRMMAFAAVVEFDWDGRAEWVLAQLQDDSLLQLADGTNTYSPVTSMVVSDQAHWTGVMLPLLESTDRTVRSHAAGALARVDEIAPLLPWLSDPDWAEDRDDTRLHLIQSAGRYRLHDAIPHLVHVVGNDPVDAHRAAAAESLQAVGDTSGHTAMRAALRTMADGNDRRRVVQVLVQTGGLSAAELARGVEAYVRHQKPSAPPASIDVTIGAYVAEMLHDRDDIASHLIARLHQLEESEPDVAGGLLGLMQWWNGPAMNTLRMERIENGTANATLIVSALLRRPAIRQTAAATLLRLAAGGGRGAGFAAAISGDAKSWRTILGGNDREAQRAFLAATRVIRDPLPVEEVKALRGHTPALDAAVEAWLAAR